LIEDAEEIRIKRYALALLLVALLPETAHAGARRLTFL
jgi:hypothetical protein